MKAEKELRILETAMDARRVRIGILASGMSEKLRDKAVSPPTLIAAGAVGFAIEQGGRHRVTSLAEMLAAVQVYGLAAISLLDWMSDDATGDDTG